MSDQAVPAYFSGLGYHVTYDYKKKSGEVWWEILDDEGLVCQIDQHVPLAAIVEDLTCWSKGLEGTSKPTYTINLPFNSERSDRLLRLVATHSL